MKSLMKKYFLVLGAVIGVNLLCNLAMPEVEAEIKTQTVAAETTSLESIEAMLMPEMALMDELPLEGLTDVAEVATIAAAPVVQQPSASVAVPNAGVLNYTVTVQTADIVAHPDYANIYRTGRVVYAHNTANLFGNLSSLSVGTVFNLTENGVVTTYQVTDVKVFEKNPENGKLQLNGNGDYMRLVMEKAFYHEVALMTCTGTSYGNGDASHRLVVFADKI